MGQVIDTKSGVRLGELVESFGGELIGSADKIVVGIAPLEHANKDAITFLSNSKFRQEASQTQAAALIARPADLEFLRPVFQGELILVDDPYVYFAKASQLFAKHHQVPIEAGIHPSANVDPSARIAKTASIGPFVCIEANVVIDDNVCIDAGSFVGRDSHIGASTHVHANATIHHKVQLGQRCIVYSGAVIGSDGFGHANDKGRWIKILQTGGVSIGDDVSVGANTCIDRGALVDTVIEEGVKLDNQIQIGHNCHIGAHTAIAGCVGIAGSTKIGRYCTIAGAAMIGGHLTIVDHVHILPATPVPNSILKPGTYCGFYPIAEDKAWRRTAVLVRNIERLHDKIKRLEKMVAG